MKSLVLLSFLTFSFLLSAKGQQLCMEPRNNDDAIVKKLEVVSGKYYLTVDVVQIIYNDMIEIKNVNPKLRTFLIDPSVELTFCAPENRVVKIRDLVNMKSWIDETMINYTAAEGRITDILHHSCSN